MNARKVTFEYDGNQFDLQFETDSLQIYLDNYEYVLFREGLMNAIDSLGDNVIVVTDDVLSELIADKDEDNHKKYDGKTLIDVDSKIYKCRDWWGITQAGQRITIHQIDAVEDLDNKYVVTLSQDIIGAEDGMNKYRFTVPDVVGHYIYTQDNDEHRDSDFWYNDPFERLDSPRHNPLTERLSGYFDFREKGYVDKDL